MMKCRAPYGVLSRRIFPAKRVLRFEILQSNFMTVVQKYAQKSRLANSQAGFDVFQKQWCVLGCPTLCMETLAIGTCWQFTVWAVNLHPDAQDNPMWLLTILLQPPCNTSPPKQHHTHNHWALNECPSLNWSHSPFCCWCQ